MEDIQHLQSGSLFPEFPGFPKPGGPTPPPLPGTPGVTPPPLPQDFSCHDPREVLRSQDLEAYAALAGLPADVQQEFLNLVRTIGFQPKPVKGGGMFGAALGALGTKPPEPMINPDLLGLLKRGRLLRRDSQGRSLLQNLTSLSTQEMGPRLDRKTIFKELCSHLNEPGRIHQGRKNTCAPTTIQHLPDPTTRPTPASTQMSPSELSTPFLETATTG